MTEPATAPLGAQAARQLANTTKTPPLWVGVTPRWLTSLLPWTPVEAGTYRVNRVKEGGDAGIAIECSPSDGDVLPKAYIDYDEQPREYTLSTVTTTIEIQTRISDLYRSPMDQVREQLAVLIEMVKERQETELINNPNYGLLYSAQPSMTITPRHASAAPTPDDLDELIAKVWKEPAFFLAHPRAIAAFGRECTRRGVPPPTVTMFGSPFLTWRGLPLVPTDKLGIVAGKSSILLMRTGEKKRGVVGLFQPGIPGEASPSLSVRLMGINQRGAAEYLVSLYCSAAVLTEDALGILTDVSVDSYHEYR
jgi:hypothetical protein